MGVKHALVGVLVDYGPAGFTGFLVVADVGSQPLVYKFYLCLVYCLSHRLSQVYFHALIVYNVRFQSILFVLYFLTVYCYPLIAK